MKWPETRLSKRVRELEQRVQDLETELEEEYVSYNTYMETSPHHGEIDDLVREVDHLRWFTADRNHAHQDLKDELEAVERCLGRKDE